jgi:hypothetical protein
MDVDDGNIKQGSSVSEIGNFTMANTTNNGQKDKGQSS